MINRHNVAEHAVEGENPVSCGEHIPTVSSGNAVMLGEYINRRLGAYRRDVLDGTGIAMTVIFQCATLQWNLTKRKALYMSITEMLEDETYDYYVHRRNALHNAMDALHAHGLLDKRTRKAKRGTALVLMWGFTAKGRRMMDKYYGYLGGEYDHLLG